MGLNIISEIELLPHLWTVLACNRRKEEVPAGGVQVHVFGARLLNCQIFTCDLILIYTRGLNDNIDNCVPPAQEAPSWSRHPPRPRGRTCCAALAGCASPSRCSRAIAKKSLQTETIDFTISPYLCHFLNNVQEHFN